MEKRVIKFNLVGAICITILFIAIITWIIVLIVSFNKEKTDSKDKISQNQEDTESYSELDTKEFAKIDGKTKEIIMRRFESKYGYTMNYDVDSFYIDTNVKSKDSFKSLISNTISLEVQEHNDDFQNVINDLTTNESQNKENRINYNLDMKDLNGRLCYIEQETKNDIIYYNYYIKNADKYFIINVRCGSKFVNTNIPIIEQMIRSFTVK